MKVYKPRKWRQEDGQLWQSMSQNKLNSYGNPVHHTTLLFPHPKHSTIFLLTSIDADSPNEGQEMDLDSTKQLLGATYWNALPFIFL